MTLLFTAPADVGQADPGQAASVEPRHVEPRLDTWPCPLLPVTGVRPVSVVVSARPGSDPSIVALVVAAVAIVTANAAGAIARVTGSVGDCLITGCPQCAAIDTAWRHGHQVLLAALLVHLVLAALPGRDRPASRAGQIAASLTGLAGAAWFPAWAHLSNP